LLLFRLQRIAPTINEDKVEIETHMINNNVNNIIVLAITIFCLNIFFSKRIRTSKMWHATVTPLASIIGSGFLVSAPLLVLIGGRYAAILMLVVVVIAYALGGSIRLNILYAERTLNNLKAQNSKNYLRTLSNFTLGIAYLISVAFYLKLLSAFCLEAVGYKTVLNENIFTTALLVFIGIVGKLRGLKWLEVIEVYCVNTKLAIITAMLSAYAIYNIDVIMTGSPQPIISPKETLWLGFRKILGIIIIIQGFETSRYLREAYDPKTLILSMRNAQIISGIIYVIFITLTMIVIGNTPEIKETLIMTVSSKVATSLPFLLLIAAVMSQFSAAIADTIGGGGLLIEVLKKKISIKNAYLIMAIFTCILTWLTNIFEIIVIASKAFALYYFFQINITLINLKYHPVKIKWLYSLFYFLLMILMGMAVILGIPAA